MSADELLVEALRLSRTQRAQVAEELWSSLEEGDEAVAAAWADELVRRARDIAAGRVAAVPWSSARAEILSELGQRRASRAAS